MQTVALPGTDLTPSRLAFGSALLMVRRGRRESVRLLEVAHDSGITHFDTARSYGYGEAESALGEFISRRRDDVTVATKLGIVPPRRSRGLRAAKVLARVAANRVPALRPVLRRGAQAAVRAGRFHPSEARSSLETSLRELRTEAVDILLLHECKPEDLQVEGLLSFLEEVVREGKVRYFGTATDPESTGVILTERPEFARVVQLSHNVLDRTLEQLPALSRAAVITHSAVRTPLTRLTELMRDGERRERWSETLGVDCAQPGALGRLLLAYALESNAALVDGEQLSSKQIRDFGRLVRESITVPAA
jgi:D-threo-aldose 1-dehydrogenase